MSVYCLFCADGEGDGGTVFSLMGVYSDLDLAIDHTLRREPISKPMDLVHKNMSEYTGYIAITKRSECNKECRYSKFGGYVIEEVAMNKILDLY